MSLHVLVNSQKEVLRRIQNLDKTNFHLYMTLSIITIKGWDRTLTEVFNLCHTVPNRLCWSFKPLNTWHELFYRNALKNFFGWNLSEAHTCAMREGSLCLKQSDELWFSFFYLRLLTCFPLAYTVLRAVTMCPSCVNVCVEQCLIG